MARLTPWFPASVKPVRKGWYEYSGRAMDAGMRMFWNGRQFGYWATEAAYVTNNWVRWHSEDDDRWRGSATKPKAPRHG